MIAVLDQGRAQTTSYAYDGVGNRAGQTHPNGTTVAYTYDERNRLKTLLHKASAAANAAILLSLSYSVDASGLRTQIAETRPNPTASQPAIMRTTDYQYDAVKRLTREQVTGTQSQGRTTVFTYDKVGNRKTEATSGTLSKNQTLTYDNNDRLTRVAGTGGTIDHVYDNAGNLIEKKQGTTTLERYTFDAEGRLTAATIGAGASQKVLSYRYDPNGIRRSQHVETATGQARTEYLVDPNQAYAQVLEEYDTQAATGQALPASTLATTYVYGDDLISQTQLALAGNTTHVYHYDGLGTTRALSAHNLDAQGNPVTTGPNAHATITDRYAYTAFGENDPAGASGNTAGSTDNNYRYTGEQLDPNLGFYYLRARYMDPRTGRFVGLDSWTGSAFDPPSLHKYAYVHNNPIIGVDPSGRSFLSMVGGFALRGASFVVYTGIHITARVGSGIVAQSIGALIRGAGHGLYRVVGLPPRLLRLNAGRFFESVLNPAMRMMGGIPQVVINVGSRTARPDWVLAGKNIVDAKLGQYIASGQARVFFEWAAARSGSITYVAWTQPPAATVAALNALATTHGVPLRIVFFLL